MYANSEEALADPAPPNKRVTQRRASRSAALPADTLVVTPGALPGPLSVDVGEPIWMCVTSPPPVLSEGES
jgi:hypothetical protein